MDQKDDRLGPLLSLSLKVSLDKSNNSFKRSHPGSINNYVYLAGGGTGTTDSTRSISSISSVSSVGSAHSPGLRANIMRMQKNRNPMIYYETVQVLGYGSMGSVVKVKKRDSVIGGSSRDEFVQSIHGPAEMICFSLPLIGNFLRICTGKDLGHKVNRNRDLFQSCQSTTSITSPTKKSANEGESNKTINGRAGRNLHHAVSSMIAYGHNDLFYALKTIHLDRVNDPSYVHEIMNEIEILKTLDHPNIVRPMETFHYRNNTCIVMELCSGGDLYTRDPYSEAYALRIVTSVLSAVEYMHSKNIIHRDLKYENIMFCDKSPDSDVKVIDYGLSVRYGKNSKLHEGVGTFYSMAPEVILGTYDNKADIWSVGVIAFMLLSSEMPFYGKTRGAVIKKILACKYQMRGRRWKKVSTSAKSFLREMLKVDPVGRPAAAEALREDWISQQINSSSCHSSDEEDQHMNSVQASIETFADYSKLKKLALMVVAHKSTSKEIGFLRKLFDKYDRKHNGMITFVDFQQALEGYGYSESELQKMFIGADLDGTGIIHYTEFLAATIEAHGAINEEALAEAFDRIDSDDSGYISTKNLREILGAQVPKEYIEDIITEADITMDHRISYAEFLALWDQQQEEIRLDVLKKIEQRRFTCKTSGLSSLDSSLHSIPETSPVKLRDEESTMDSSLRSIPETLSVSSIENESISFIEDADLFAQAEFRKGKALSFRRYKHAGRCNAIPAQ